MKRTVATLATAAVLTLTLGATLHAQSGFEKDPVLKASDLVAPELLKGPSFTVDERVPVRGFLAIFTIRSPYGTFEAHGIHMLHVRVAEVRALGELDNTSKTKEFAEAAGKAIARPVTSAANMLMNPVETVKGLPDGVARLFGRIKLGGETVMAAASAPGKTDEERAAAVTQRVGSITADVFGFEKERRELARSLGVDPYTTNPVLAKKLTDMAWVAFSGRMAIQVVTTVVVPYSTVMSAVSITNSTVYETSPGDLINNAQAIFAGTGANEGEVRALLKNPQYSLSVLTALAMGVERLQGVNGLASIVTFAAIAKTEDEARLVAGAVNMLARYHASVEPIATVTAPGPIIGRTAAGTLVLPAPVDYVPWVERLTTLSQRVDLKAPKRIAWLSGQTSPRAQKELLARGWTVYESFTVAAER